MVAKVPLGPDQLYELLVDPVQCMRVFKSLKVRGGHSPAQPSAAPLSASWPALLQPAGLSLRGELRSIPRGAARCRGSPSPRLQLARAQRRCAAPPPPARTHPHPHRFLASLQRVQHRRVLSDDGAGNREVEVDQTGSWRFLCFRGAFTVRMVVEQRRADRTVSWRGAGCSRHGAAEHASIGLPCVMLHFSSYVRVWGHRLTSRSVSGSACGFGRGSAAQHAAPACAVRLHDGQPRPARTAADPLPFGALRLHEAVLRHLAGREAAGRGHAGAWWRPDKAWARISRAL